MAYIKQTLYFITLLLIIQVSLCYLTSINDRQTRARAVCCYEYAGQEIVDNDLADALGTKEYCCETCSNLDGCLGWVWDNADGGTCYFKSTSGPTITKIGATTGVFCDASKKQKARV